MLGGDRSHRLSVLSLAAALLACHAPGPSPAATPQLSIPSSPRWEQAERRVELRVENGRGTARLLYDRESGAPRELTLEPGEVLDPPLSGVAARVVAPAGEPWWNVLPWIERIGMDVLGEHVFLGGELPDGRPGAIPLYVDRPAEPRRLGVAVTPKDLVGGAPREGRVLGRLTRVGGDTRFRWGFIEEGRPGDPVPIAWQDAPIADHLREYRFPTSEGPRLMVLLDVGPGVTFEDVLRVVEQAGGRPDVFFFPFPRPEPVPRPREPADAEFLRPDVPRGDTLFVLADGESRTPILPSTQPLPAGAPIRIQADPAAPWPAVREALAQIRAEGRPVEIVFAPEASHVYRQVRVPAAGSAKRRIDAHVIPAPADAGPDALPGIRLTGDPNGADVTLTAAEGATAGDVLPAVLHLLRRGAEGVAVP